MFEAYSVGVTLKLHNLVSPQLALMSREFAALQKEASALNALFKNMERTAAAFGSAARSAEGATASVRSTTSAANEAAGAFNRATAAAANYKRELALLRGTAGHASVNASTALVHHAASAGGGGSYVPNTLLLAGQGAGKPSGMPYTPFTMRTPGGGGVVPPGGGGGGGAGGSSMGIGGIAGSAFTVGAGVSMFGRFRGPIGEALNYERDLARMRQMGLGDAQIADAQKFVQATDIIGTSVQQRLKLFTEAQGAFRESGMGGTKALDAAKVMMPVLAEYQVASSMLSGPNKHAVENAMQSMNKTVEMLGGLGNTARASGISEAIFKAVQSSGKMVTERDLKQFVAMGGNAVSRLSDKSIFASLEPLMGEMGGSAVGTAMLTAYGRTHGILSKPPKLMVNEMLRLGIWDKKKLEFNSQGGIKKMTAMPMDKKLAELQETDFQGFLEEMLARYSKAGITEEADVGRENDILFGRTGGKLYSRAMRQIKTLRHSGEAYDEAVSPKGVIKQGEKGPLLAFERYHKAMDELSLAIGKAVMPVLTPFIVRLTELAKELGKHPAILKTLVIGFGALAGAMALGGSVLLLKTAFSALGLVIGGGGTGLLGALTIAKLTTAVIGLGGAFAALGVGFAVGSALQVGIDALLTKIRGKDTSLGSSIYDWVHSGEGEKWNEVGQKNRMGGFGRTGVSPYVANGGAGAGRGVLNATVNIDGRQAFKAMVPYMDKESSRPGTGGRTFDGSMSPRQPDMGTGG